MINIQLRNIKKYSLAFLAFGVLIYGTVYFQAQNGEAFHFIESKAFNSKNLDALVGKVKAVELSPFGSYHEKYIDNDQIILMEVKIIGELKTVKMQINLKKTMKYGRLKMLKLMANHLVLTHLCDANSIGGSFTILSQSVSRVVWKTLFCPP